MMLLPYSGEAYIKIGPCQKSDSIIGLILEAFGLTVEDVQPHMVRMVVGNKHVLSLIHI